MEIERKFLVTAVPSDELGESRAVEIVQGYLAAGEDGSEVRLRRVAGELWLTAKRGAGMVRGEHEVALSVEQFNALWPATEGRRLAKTRHALPLGELQIELDVYSGSLSGLVVAEVEFPTVELARAFAPPPWFGREVTDDQRFKNRRLAEDGLPD